MCPFRPTSPAAYYHACLPFMRQSVGWPGLRILAYAGGLINQELLLRCEYLAEENRILKEHIKGQLRVTDAERRSLAESGHRLGRKLLNDVARLAKPDQQKALTTIRDAAKASFSPASLRLRCGEPSSEASAKA